MNHIFNTRVRPVLQYRFQTGIGEITPHAALDVPPFQILHNRSDGLALRIPFAYFQNNRCALRVYFQLMLLEPIPKGNAPPVTAAFQCVFLLASMYLLRQLRRVVFRHALQYNAVRPQKRLEACPIFECAGRFNTGVIYIYDYLINGKLFACRESINEPRTIIVLDEFNIERCFCLWI